MTYIDKEIKKLKQKYETISKMGFIESKFKGSGSAGILFERLIGLDYNPNSCPDFNGIEIKTKRDSSNYPFALFSAIPSGPTLYETDRIRKKYGYPYYADKKENILNARINSINLTKVGLFYYFKLNVDDLNKKIYLEIYNCRKKLIEKYVYWDFNVLIDKLTNKLEYLAFVKVKTKYYNKKTYFNYYDCNIYRLKQSVIFFELIKNGKISLNIRLGIRFDSNVNAIVTYNRGMVFEMEYNNLELLFNKI